MILLFGACGAAYILLTLPFFLMKLADLPRWQKLTGVLLYWIASWWLAEALFSLGQLNLNWQEGYDSMRKLDAFISALNTGTPLPEIRYDFLWTQQRLAFISCVAGVCCIITAALLAVNPYKKYTWIVFLVAPLWFGGSFLWSRTAERKFMSRVWRTSLLAGLKFEIETARAKGIPDPLIAGNLSESRALFRFGYENIRTGRESVRRTLESLKNLKGRVEIQQAKEVLKKTDCICGPAEDKTASATSSSAAFRILYRDAVRNGTAEVVRLLDTARTNEGRVCAMAILFRLDPEAFRMETLAIMPGEVHFRRDGKGWTEPAEKIRLHPERLEKAPFDELFSLENGTD
ncbi:MAG: hypothetical protein BWY31_01814 [Lentisphaerae bacterium ADurb.Bin242]|nr:MAG: hypothetical protein BWY31_01814 [Lentisphaerae bacterium ADurb.Bin242]